MTDEGIKVFIGCVFLLLKLAIFPLVFLWLLNSLFGLGLDYSFFNWLLALMLLLVTK